MKKIICPFCGVVKQYVLHERVHRGLIFDANDEPCGSTEDIADYSSTVKRCVLCDRKVKILEQLEEREEN